MRSSGGQRAAYLALKNCGGAEQRASLPAASAWMQLSVSTTVSNGQCTISFYSDANADVSSLKKNEDHGAVYRTSSGVQQDALAILRASGVNYARLRVWVNPADGYHTKARVLAMAARVKAQGMKLLVDFHYSDSWADPGQQDKPAAWRSYSFSQLRDAVYNHTFDVLNSLKAQGTTADMVQIGNEINGGMLWPDGSTSNWATWPPCSPRAAPRPRRCPARRG